MNDFDNQQRMNNKDFERLSSFIYQECGIKMPPAKRTMLEARLQKRLRVLSIGSFTQYCDYLFSQDGQQNELIHMIDVVTTNKTDFFREPEHYSYLVTKVLPEWSATNGLNHPLSIWSAGCSTGEEPYTLSMVLNEYAEEHPGFNFKIMASDISTRVLEKAGKAIYDMDRIGPISDHMRRKYLLRSKDRNSELVRIVPSLREKIRFQRINFMDSDFGLREPFDIIFCRNVIIYFDRPTQERLLNKFYQKLKPGGWVFMGHSETLSGLDVPLTMVHPTVYKKI
jgi:chemotaxis protein methyltransferase CheR